MFVQSLRNSQTRKSPAKNYTSKLSQPSLQLIFVISHSFDFDSLYAVSLGEALYRK
jgi:hypothetical protein